MTRTRRALKAGVYTLVVGSLVLGTGSFIRIQVADEASLNVAAPVAQSQAGASTSADVPVLNTALTGEDLVELTPASRSSERTLLLDGQGVEFTIVVDGVATPFRSDAETLADALSEAGVSLGWDDVVSADLSSAPQEGAVVTIARAGTSYVTEQIVTPHESEERSTSQLLIGTTRVVQEGVDGDARVTFAVELLDGVEVSRSQAFSITLNAPVTEIVEVGTRKPAPVVAAPAPKAPATGSGTGAAPAADPAAPAAPAAPVVPADPGSNRAIAQEMLAARGWGSEQWTCLDSLWQKESGWNHLAKNRSSGAYGIPQSLPGSKMASAGSDWQTNPATQISWGLGYIQGRYGTPCGAWEHSKLKNWY